MEDPKSRPEAGSPGLRAPVKGESSSSNVPPFPDGATMADPGSKPHDPDTPFHLEEAGVDLTVTISIGVALYRDARETSASLLNRADEALYAAKAKGRNCVVCADEEPAAAPRAIA